MSNEQIEKRVQFILNTEAGKNLTVSQIVALYKEVEDMFAPKPQVTNSKGIDYRSLDEVKELVAKHPKDQKGNAITEKSSVDIKSDTIFSRLDGRWHKAFGNHLASWRVRKEDYREACGFSEDYKFTPPQKRANQGKVMADRHAKKKAEAAAALTAKSSEQAVG